MFSGRKNWKRPRNMRTPQRAPSQCNISEQTLSLPLQLRFYKRRTIYRKKKKKQKWLTKRSVSSDVRRLNSSSVVTDSALCIFSLRGNWNQDYWGNMTLSSWHFCTLHRFSFLLDSKKREEKKANEDQGAEAFYSDDACKISRDMNRWKSEKRHAGSRFRLHFYILKGKNTAISLEQKKENKT